MICWWRSLTRCSSSDLYVRAGDCSGPEQRAFVAHAAGSLKFSDFRCLSGLRDVTERCRVNVTFTDPLDAHWAMFNL
jgi:hypothetical protein